MNETIFAQLKLQLTQKKLATLYHKDGCCGS